MQATHSNSGSDQNDQSLGEAKPTRPERLAADLAAFGIAALCLIITITVVSRWVYRGLIPDDVLIIREIMVVVILLPLAAVSASRAQIAVTVLTNHLRGRANHLLDALGNLVGLIFIGMLLFAGLRMLAGSWDTQDYYEGQLSIPMWLANLVYSVGLSALFLRLAANLVGDLRLFLASRS